MKYEQLKELNKYTNDKEWYKRLKNADDKKINEVLEKFEKFSKEFPGKDVSSIVAADLGYINDEENIVNTNHEVLNYSNFLISCRKVKNKLSKYYNDEEINKIMDFYSKNIDNYKLIYEYCVINEDDILEKLNCEDFIRYLTYYINHKDDDIDEIYDLFTNLFIYKTWSIDEMFEWINLSIENGFKFNYFIYDYGIDELRTFDETKKLLNYAKDEKLIELVANTDMLSIPFDEQIYWIEQSKDKDERFIEVIINLNNSNLEKKYSFSEKKEFIKNWFFKLKNNNVYMLLSNELIFKYRTLNEILEEIDNIEKYGLTYDYRTMKMMLKNRTQEEENNLEKMINDDKEAKENYVLKNKNYLVNRNYDEQIETYRFIKNNENKKADLFFFRIDDIVINRSKDEQMKLYEYFILDKKQLPYIIKTSNNNISFELQMCLLKYLKSLNKKTEKEFVLNKIMISNIETIEDMEYIINYYKNCYNNKLVFKIVELCSSLNYNSREILSCIPVKNIIFDGDRIFSILTKIFESDQRNCNSSVDDIKYVLNYYFEIEDCYEKKTLFLNIMYDSTISQYRNSKEKCEIVKYIFKHGYDFTNITNYIWNFIKNKNILSLRSFDEQMELFDSYLDVCKEKDFSMLFFHPKMNSCLFEEQKEFIELVKDYPNVFPIIEANINCMPTNLIIRIIKIYIIYPYDKIYNILIDNSIPLYNVKMEIINKYIERKNRKYFRLGIDKLEDKSADLSELLDYWEKYKIEEILTYNNKYKVKIKGRK